MRPTLSGAKHKRAYRRLRRANVVAQYVLQGWGTKKVKLLKQTGSLSGAHYDAPGGPGATISAFEGHRTLQTALGAKVTPWGTSSQMERGWGTVRQIDRRGGRGVTSLYDYSICGKYKKKQKKLLTGRANRPYDTHIRLDCQNRSLSYGEDQPVEHTGRRGGATSSP